MKKILVFMLVAVMVLTSAAICSSANDVNDYVEYRDELGEVVGEPQNGNVPKIVSSIAIDGVMESVYTRGLRANISTLYGNGMPVSGTVYMLYDDNYLYAYVECNDPVYFDITPLITICPSCGKQRGVDSRCEHMKEEGYAGDMCGTRKVNIWDDDCVEFMIDWSDDGSTPSQYRISRSGWMSRDYDTAITGFSGKGQDYGETWGAEFAIGLDSSVKGTDLGITVMIHSQDELTPEKWQETYAMMNNSSCYGTPWEPQYFDYIVLGDLIELPPDIFIPDPKLPIVKDPVRKDPTVDDPTVGDPTIDGPTTKQPVNSPANTADPIALMVLLALASLGAALVVKKTCFTK